MPQHARGRLAASARRTARPLRPTRPRLPKRQDGSRFYFYASHTSVKYKVKIFSLTGRRRDRVCDQRCPAFLFENVTSGLTVFMTCGGSSSSRSARGGHVWCSNLNYRGNTSMQPRWQQTRRVYLQYTLRKKEGTNNLTHQGKGPEDQTPQNCTSIDPAGAAIACYSRQRCRGGGVKVPVRTDSMVGPSYTVGRHADLDDDRCAHSNGAELLVKGDAGAQRLAVERD